MLSTDVTWYDCFLFPFLVIDIVAAVVMSLVVEGVEKEDAQNFAWQLR